MKNNKELIPKYIFKKNQYCNFTLSGYEYKGLNIFICGQNGFWFILKNEQLNLLEQIYSGNLISSSSMKLEKMISGMPQVPPMKKFDAEDYVINEIQIEEMNFEQLQFVFKQHFSLRSFFTDSCSIGMMFYNSLSNVQSVISLSEQYNFQDIFGEFDINFFQQNQTLPIEINKLCSIHIHNSNYKKDVNLIKSVRKQYSGELIIHLSDFSLIEKYTELCLELKAYLVFEYTDNYKYIMDYINFVNDNQRNWPYNLLKYSRIDIFKDQVLRSQYVSNCNLGYNEIYIDKKLDLYACISCKLQKYKVIGNLLCDNLLDLWKNSPSLQYMRSLNVQMFEECRYCDFRYLCGGQCRLKAYKSTNSILKTVPYCESMKRVMLDSIFNKYQCMISK